MNRATLFCALSAVLFLNLSAIALEDDAATVGLWHFETIDEGVTPPTTPDDDSQHAGRDLDLACTISGSFETPPAVVSGYEGNALQFSGYNCLRSPTSLWQSSYTEIKLDFMIYVTTLPWELNADIAYIFEIAPVWQLDLWPTKDGGVIQPDQDLMRFSVYMSDSSKLSADIPFPSSLKNQWVHVVGSYDVARNYRFSLTPVGGTETLVTKTGTKAMRSSSGRFDLGMETGHASTNRGFHGMIDEVKISNFVTTPHYAFWPFPVSGSTVYAQPDLLTWSKGLVVEGSDAFFGTSSSAVSAATKPAHDLDGSTFIDFGDFAVLGGQWQQAPVYPSADINGSGFVDGGDFFGLVTNWLTSTTGAYPLYLGSTTGTSLSCPALLPATTYYWRVDSVNTSENTKGNTFSFTTGDAAATSPAPTTGATNVAADANTVTLKWTAGFGATEHNVYFGTANNPPLLATVSQASLAVSGLAPDTKYYWRIDATGPLGTTTGTVWNFTTGTIGAFSPSPTDTATDVTFPHQGMDLSWASTFAPASYNVYFGTVNPPPYLATTTGPSLGSPDVMQNTTYYWRVDCISIFGTVTGTVWSFATATPAFPEAEGFGRFAKGGRGGTVYHVTRLDDPCDGTGKPVLTAGTFRDAVSAANRTIVFDVGGYITLNADPDYRLGITKNNITIAGQTAPGGGIGISGTGISIGADDLIMRYVRVRYTGPIQDDTLSMNKSCDNNIIDHVSTSWGTDEVLSVTESRNITVQWSIVSEGQNTFNHSKGSLLEWPVLSWHHNIYAHNDDRNPKNKGTFDYRNNVVYNWGFAPYITGDSGGMSYANCIGNYYIAGASTTSADNIMIILGNLNYSMYLSDNRIDSNRNGVKDGVDLGTDLIDPARPLTVMPTPFDYPPVTTTSPEVAYTQVLGNAGCSLVRDSIDTRIINDIINETGYIITNYTDRGGLGTIAGGTPPLDTDQDGMPDAWEDSHGLLKNDDSDRNGDQDGDGYTNLEEYLNSLTVYP